MTTITCKVPEKLASNRGPVASGAPFQIGPGARSVGGPSSWETPAWLGARRRTARHLRGSLKGGPSDLATNPKHMKGFGE